MLCGDCDMFFYTFYDRPNHPKPPLFRGFLRCGVGFHIFSDEQTDNACFYAL